MLDKNDIEIIEKIVQKKTTDVVVEAINELIIPQFEKIDKRFENVEQRLDKIEKRLDILEERVENLENLVDRILRTSNKIQDQLDNHATRILSLETAKL